MDIETIRKKLEFNTGRFPERTVRGAIEQRDAMIPLLLAVLQEVTDDPNRMLLWALQKAKDYVVRDEDK